MKERSAFSNLFATVFFFALVYIAFFAVFTFLIFGINGHFDIFDDMFCIVMSMMLATIGELLLIYRLRKRYILEGGTNQARSFKIFMILLIVLNGSAAVFILYNINSVFSRNRFSSEYENTAYVLEERFDEIIDSSRGAIDSQSLRDIIDKLKDTAYYTWSSFEDPNIGFKIHFPGQFRDTQIVKLVDGKKRKVYYLTQKQMTEGDPNYAYSLIYYREGNLQTEAEVDDLLNRARDNFLEISNGTLLSENIINNRNFNGRSMYCKIDDSDLYIRCHTYYREPYLFSISVFTKKGQLFNNRISRFLDGFEFREINN